MMIPLTIFIVWIGIYPATFLNVSENSTKALINKLELIKFGKKHFTLPNDSLQNVNNGTNAPRVIDQNSGNNGFNGNIVP